MVRLQFPGPDSFHYQRLTAWDLLDRLNSDDLNPEDLSVYEFKVDGIPRPLTCPYCNEPHDLGSLCSHLGQKHLFESRPAVCPGCDLNQTNMLYHIVAAHQSMLRIKRRDYLQYFPPISTSARNAVSQQTQLSSELTIALSQQTQLSSELAIALSQQTPLISQETSLQTLLDRSKTHLQSLVPVEDRLRNSISDALDDFLAASNAEDTLTPSACKEEKSEEKEESDASLTPEEREEMQKRAGFVQELVMSTLFDD